ncbi:MAG: hypothetical protein AAF585_27495 [Verrucomicrobiota bacterium]
MGIFEAKTRLSEICAEVVESGDTVIISKRGQPIVEVRAFRQPADEIEGQPIAGILDCLSTCHQRFGPLKEEFEIPKWPADVRFNERDPFDNYWDQPQPAPAAAELEGIAS